MLKIIDTRGNVPSSYIVDKDTWFLPGQIATITNPFSSYFERTGTVCQGENPIGIIDDIKTQHNNSTAGSNRMTVWDKSMIVETDIWETGQAYPENATLFCNERGEFTTRRHNINCKSVGYVIKSPTYSNFGTLTLFFDVDHNMNARRELP